MKRLAALLVPLLVATLALACGEEGEEPPATPSPAATATATATPAAEATPTLEAAPTPEVADEYEGWLTYTNDVYGYEFRYPQGAMITETGGGQVSTSPEEREQGVTSEELRERYTDKICVSVHYELGYVDVSAPVNRIFFCGRTGVPACDIVNRDEALLIDGKRYTARGSEIQCPGETLSSHNETLGVALEDSTVIEYGARPLETATFEDYLEIRDDLLKIVQSYHKLPLAAQHEARVWNVAPEQLNVRGRPSASSEVIGALLEGEAVCVTGGFQSADGFRWWPVRTQDGLEGWAAQADPEEPEWQWLSATGRTCED